MSAGLSTALSDVSAGLGIPPRWLDDLVWFESKWNPQAVNRLSGAKGLIQFLDSTARGMGYGSAGELIKRYPDTISQLKGPVYEYLAKMKPFLTEQSLYMAVFNPAYRFVSPDTVVSPLIQKMNPGIVRVSDYIKLVRGAKNSAYAVKAIIILGIAVLGFAAYKMYGASEPDTSF